jgi:hypothetical protein
MVLPFRPAAGREHHLIRDGSMAMERNQEYVPLRRPTEARSNQEASMGEPNTARIAKDFDIEAAMLFGTHERSASALAYRALALGVILTLVWFVTLTWIFALLLG